MVSPVVAVSSSSSSLLAGIGGGVTALKPAARRTHRAVRTCVRASYWEDIFAVARGKETPSQEHSKKRGEAIKAASCSEPVRAISASELWLRAETARKSAKRVCSFAAMSTNGSSFSQLQMTATCAAEWRKVEELEDAAYEAELLEISFDSGDTFEGAGQEDLSFFSR